MSTSSCEIFISHQWKPQLCRECFTLRDSHNESAIEKGKAFLGRVTLGQSNATPPMFVPPLHLVNAKPMIDVRPKGTLKKSTNHGTQPLLVTQQTKSYAVVAEVKTPSQSSPDVSPQTTTVSKLQSPNSDVSVKVEETAGGNDEEGPSETVLEFVDRLENPEHYYTPLKIPPRPSTSLHGGTLRGRVNKDLVVAPSEPQHQEQHVSTPEQQNDDDPNQEPSISSSPLSDESNTGITANDDTIPADSGNPNTASPSPASSTSTSAIAGAEGEKKSRMKETQQMLKDMGYLTTGDRIKAAPPVALPHLIGSAKLGNRSLSNYGSDSYEHSLTDRDRNSSFSRQSYDDEPSTLQAPLSPMSTVNSMSSRNSSSSTADDQSLIETSVSDLDSTARRRSAHSPSRSGVRNSSVSRSRTRGPDWKPTFNLRVATETDSSGKVRQSVSMASTPSVSTTTTLQGAPVIVEDDDYDPLEEYEKNQRSSIFGGSTNNGRTTQSGSTATATPTATSTTTNTTSRPSIPSTPSVARPSSAASSSTTSNPQAAVSPPPPRSNRPRLSVFVQTQSQQIGLAKTELQIADLYEKDTDA